MLKKRKHATYVNDGVFNETSNDLTNLVKPIPFKHLVNGTHIFGCCLHVLTLAGDLPYWLSSLKHCH